MTPEDYAKAEMLNQMMKQIDAGNYRAATQVVRGYYAQLGTPQATAFPLSLPPHDGVAYPTVESVRNFTWVGQQNSYFCGPAAGLMILKASYPYPSRVDGYSPSQDALANIHHMQTYSRRTTDWNTGLFKIGLNKWTGNSTWYTQLPKPTITQTRGALIQTVYVTRKPMAADTVETPATGPYNKHPRGWIGHWIVAYAYSSPGGVLANLATWVDPAAGVVFASAARMFNETVPNMNRFLNHADANGIAY